MAKREVPATRYVYFIEAVGLRRVKIGLANHPESRVRELQTASPAPLALGATLATNNARACEEWLHRRFSHLRIIGEWFKLNAEMRRLMGTLASWPRSAEFAPGPAPCERPSLLTPSLPDRDSDEMAAAVWTAADILYWRDPYYDDPPARLEWPGAGQKRSVQP